MRENGDTVTQLAQPTEQEKVRARYHLGYLDVSAVSTYIIGVPAMVQTQFMIERALNALNMPAYPKFQWMLGELDRLECQWLGGSNLAEVNRVDTVEINRERTKEFGQMYSTMRSALANMLGIVPNPFDQRDIFLGGMGVNVPVNH